MILRPYQEAAIVQARKAAREGVRALLLVSPTGSGKTVMLTEFVKNHLAKSPKNSVNWFAHRRELVSQAADTLRAAGLNCDTVRVLSVQTALARSDVPPCTLSVFDEAHHFGAKAAKWYALVDAHKTGFILGATATPERGDGTPLSPPFERIIVVAQVSNLIAQGYLVPSMLFGPDRVLRKSIAQSPVAEYLARGLSGKRNVVFAPNVKTARVYADEFIAAGIRCAVVYGKTPTQERDSVLQAFRAGDTPVIVNVYVLTEGFDVPAIEVVTLGRNVGSAGMFLQMVGRGMRPAAGKTSCTVLDLVGATHVHGRPDDDREFSLTGIPISAKSSAVLGLCPGCGAAMEPGLPCDQCGYLHAVPVPDVAGIRTDKYETIRQDTFDTKCHRIASWIRQGRTKGHKPYAARYKAQAVYGLMPTAREWAHALFLSQIGNT